MIENICIYAKLVHKKISAGFLDIFIFNKAFDNNSNFSRKDSHKK